MRARNSDKRVDYKARTTTHRGQAESTSSAQLGRSPQSQGLGYGQHARTNTTSYPKVAAVEPVDSPNFVGIVPGPQATRADAKNILEKAMLLANSSLDSLKEIKERDEKKQNAQLREIMELREELEEKNLLIQQLQADCGDGKVSFQKILDEKNAKIRELASEVKALRLLESREFESALCEQQLGCDARRLFRSKLKALLVQVDEVKRMHSSVEVHVSVLQKTTDVHLNQLNEKIKRKLLKSEPLIAIIEKENSELRKELAQLKIHLGSKNSKAQRVNEGMLGAEPVSEKLLMLEASLKEKSRQLEEELIKGGHLTSAKVDRLKEEKVDLLCKMVDELSKFEVITV